MRTLFLIAFLGTLAAALGFSLAGQRRVKTSLDFSLGGRTLNARGVAWVIISTIVGGASTVGTVQLAYLHGLAAWIFTLGCGLACLVLAVVFAKPLREDEVVTVSEYLGRRFGRRFQVWSSGFTSLGMFIHVVAQFLAAMAIIGPALQVGRPVAFLLAFALIAGFVVVGGLAGSRVLGKIKFALLYGILALLAAIALVRGGGLSAILDALPPGDFFQLFGARPGKGIGDLVAMIVGVVSTQTYLQALFAARDVRSARQGALIGALTIPPLGLLGVVVGLFLRVAHPDLANSGEALAFFIREYLPAPLAGVFMAGLLIVVLGTAAGLVLGVTTNLFEDLFRPMGWLRAPGRELALIRGCALGVLLLSLGLVLTGLDSAILDWSYLSMGLRGASIFLGLVLAVAFRRDPRLSRWAPVVFAGPLVYLAYALIWGR